MNDGELHELTVPDELAGKRLDQALAELFPDYSRSRLQSWIKKGRVTLDKALPVAKTKLAGGELLALTIESDVQVDEMKAEPVPLDVIFEDEEILIINKPMGLVMHPGAGNHSGTVQNGLLHRNPELAEIPRAGIVHRLDKDTTGLFVVAKTLRAHKSLVDQLQEHTVAREYYALVNSVLVSGATIDKPIARHPMDRKRMAIRENGKHAVTHYRLAEKFRAHTLVAVKLETGRTHQIRVHMSSVGFPLLGDTAYGGRPKFPKAASDKLRQAISDFKRQALHARRLSLNHPATGEEVSWEAEIPQDMQAIISLLRKDKAEHEQ